ncbi:MAG TPA: DUF2442 domain-containing protein [Pirellulales bacterium]|nr:DUF2442 domain-containing protein [Pirellulales bacterium]
MFPTIQRVSVRPDRQLLLQYADGEEVLIDFRPVTERGGVFTSLAEPEFFAQVRIGDGGRYIEWPGNLDFCADALWQEGRHRRTAVEEPISQRHTADCDVP